MRYIELQYAFELEAANLDAPVTEKLNSYDILYWLNQGVDKFIKTRYNGTNPKLTSFEQDEKRTRDLVGLLSTTIINLTRQSGRNPQYLKWEGTYPSDLMFVLDEAVNIVDPTNPTVIIPTEIFECTLDTYMYRITNRLTDFHFRHNYARPLRIRTKDGVILYTDPQYEIFDYYITYLRNPNPITLDNPFDDYTEFPEYAQNEIIKLAVQMYLENASDPRYQTKSTENQVME